MLYEKLPILIYPHPSLVKSAAMVTVFDEKLKLVAQSMIAAMIEADGIGLAAPQVGKSMRLIVLDPDGNRSQGKTMTMVNPKLDWHSSDVITTEEGCLSLPDSYGEVTRPRAIRLSYQNLAGEEKHLEAENLLAICIQHEIDHLNGKLFIDHLSPLKRNMIIRKFQKLKRLARLS